MELLLVWVILYGTMKGIQFAADYSANSAKSGARSSWLQSAKRRPTSRARQVGWFTGRTVSAGWHGAKHGASGFREGWSVGWPAGKQLAHDRYERKHTVTTPDGATVTPIRGSQPAPEATRRRPPGTPIAVPARHRTDGSSALAEPERDRLWRIRLHWAPGVWEPDPDDPDPSRSFLYWDDSDLSRRCPELDDLVAQGRLLTYDVEEYALPGDDPAPDRAWQIRLRWPDGVRTGPTDLDHPEAIAVWDEADLRRRSAGLDALVAEGKLASYEVNELHPAAEKAELIRIAEENNYWQDTPTDQPEPLATVTPLTEGADMSIATVNGGEVLTLDGLIAELEAVQKEAAGDLEDAAGDADRAREDAQRVERMVASLSALELDQQTLAEVGALAEDAAARRAAAEARQAAEERRAAHAKLALDGVKHRHALMQEAVDSTPNGGAQKGFYNH
jgi:hypothetical protein